ncbi:hypothetical protein J0X19_14165 [Hymenobacter sp. BT186]|uniref:Uncharacterized protein n=1 Tax=Hymenobacter telluris TaxID=2816474 RepID=A0A939EXR7_9BACT|nr:hypothetical protein [Hymenobacter telluris]MBO0359101.1 hypothetical protein [Hymenobacter telluris]MBW3375127.1 hypothetical protein [Hymenobacter norwichensis]
MLAPTPPPRRQPPASNRVQALRPTAKPLSKSRPVSGRVVVAQQGKATPRVAPRPVSQRPRAIAPPSIGARMLAGGVQAARAYGQYSIGFYEGVGASLKGTWNFATHDAWQAKTWTEMGTTIVAVSLIGQTPGNPTAGMRSAQWLDQKLGTQFAPRQVQIVMALDRTIKEMPSWKARQWGKVVGRVAGDVLTTKGAGGAAKTGFRIAATEVQHVRTITKLTGSVAKAAPAYGRFTSVRAQIPFRNVSTPPGKSAFWSGLEGVSGGKAAQEAEMLARLNGRTSLEMTRGGAWLDRQTVLLDGKVDWRTQMRPQWGRLSRRFARGASGSVEVYKGPFYDPKFSIWATIEEKELATSMQAGRVTEIQITTIPKK